MLFQNTVHICIYMDGLIIIINDTFKNPMDILHDVLNWLEKSGIWVNAVKWEWAVNSVICIGFMVTQNIIKLQPSNVNVIMVIEPLKKKYQIRISIRMVNFYFFLCKKLLHTLDHLSKPSGKIIWGGVRSSNRHN